MIINIWYLYYFLKFLFFASCYKRQKLKNSYIMNKDWINLQFPNPFFWRALNPSWILHEKIFQEDKLFCAHVTNVETNAFHQPMMMLSMIWLNVVSTQHIKFGTYIVIIHLRPMKEHQHFNINPIMNWWKI